ncbi:MAG: HEPN-associated N-terminal domain-containing protein [Bacteriovorax sp.]|nr:HEPN-associated N-terminal domain-containing protein [Bacteriovorax sp.]
MGQTKRRIDRETEHGYTSIDSRICNHCVSDRHIKQFIKGIGEKSKCDYCEKNRAKTVEFNKFIEFFLEHVDSLYSDPLEVLVNFEDGETFGISELLDDIDLTEQESLRNDVEYSLSDREWCETPYYHYEESEALNAGWEKFAAVVKRNRYTFHQLDDEHFYEPIRPSAFLPALSHVISRIGLYKTLTKGTSLYRVRIEKKNEKFTKASELASPPANKAIYPNRMSPSGIPMFYGAFDIGTAIKETYSGNKEHIATIAKFKFLKDIILVDLSKIPPYLDFFEDADYNNQQIEFLNDFVKAISAPIDRDGREHVEYVPTQIITEHLRYVHHKMNDNEEILGLIYPSSKSNGKKSVVIFCENEHCVEKGDGKEDSFFELELPLRRVNPQSFI